MKFWKWTTSHWVYCLALMVGLTAVVLVLLGKLTPDGATGLALFALTLFAADFRPKLERHQAEMRNIFLVIAAAGRAASSHNVPAAIAAGELAVVDGAKLAEEVKAEKS